MLSSAYARQVVLPLFCCRSQMSIIRFANIGEVGAPWATPLKSVATFVGVCASSNAHCNCTYSNISAHSSSFIYMFSSRQLSIPNFGSDTISLTVSNILSEGCHMYCLCLLWLSACSSTLLSSNNLFSGNFGVERLTFSKKYATPFGTLWRSSSSVILLACIDGKNCLKSHSIMYLLRYSFSLNICFQAVNVPLPGKYACCPGCNFG